MLSDKDKIDIDNLIFLLKQLEDHLTKVGAGEYSLIKKTLRVLSNSDSKGRKNININLSSVFRMMADNGLYGGDENKIISKIYRVC